MLANRITEVGGQEALYVSSFAEAVKLAASAAMPGDMILTLGAGSVSHLAPQVLDASESRAQVDTAALSRGHREFTLLVQVCRRICRFRFSLSAS